MVSKECIKCGEKFEMNCIGEVCDSSPFCKPCRGLPR